MKNKTHHIVLLLKTLNARRAINFVKLFLSYHLSRFLKRPIVWGRPFAFSLEPTTSCNLRCPECPSGLRSFSRDTGMLPMDYAETTIKKLSKYAGYMTLYFQGEPYLNKDFFEIVVMAKQHKLFVNTSTNAHYLKDENARKTVESGLDRLIISIDGITQQTYESYRIGGKLDKVIEGTRNIIAWKKKLKSKTPQVIFQFLVVKPNEHEIPELYKLAEDLEVDKVLLKTAQVYDYKHGNPLIPDNIKYSRYKQNADGTFSIKNKLLNQCWRMWQACVVTWDGNMVPCCFDKDATYKMGNILEHDLDEVWWSAAYKKFRQQLLVSRSSIDICTNCTEGTKVWVEE